MKNRHSIVSIRKLFELRLTTKILFYEELFPEELDY